MSQGDAQPDESKGDKEKQGGLRPPYAHILRELRAGRVIPFLGAGASFGARNPKQVPWRAREGGDWKTRYLPTATELAEYIAEQGAFPEGESRELTKVAQYFNSIIGREPLHQLLHEVFSFAQEPSALHGFLAETSKSKPLLIVTTNYDELIEKAFKSACQPYDTVIHVVSGDGKGDLEWCPHEGKPERLLSKQLDIDLNSVSVIYKMHGAIEQADTLGGKYVITEDDYIDFLTRFGRLSAFPRSFAEPFQKRPFLFLGYGLYDWNLRVLLNRIDKRRKTDAIVSWAIETLPKALESELWRKRNVRVFDGVTLEDFVENLRAAAGGKNP